MRRTDLLLLALFSGMIAMLLPVLLFAFTAPEQVDESDVNHWHKLTSGVEVYFFTFCIVAVIACAGVGIKVFRETGINYTFIFEVQNDYPMIHHQFFRVALMYFFVWFFCLTW